jgi:hypothetical protein
MMLAIIEIQICERKGRKTQMTKTEECKAPWTTELENPENNGNTWKYHLKKMK